MKISFNAKINSIFAIGGIFLALSMVYSKGRSDLIEQIYSLKQEPKPEKKTAMPRAKKKTTTSK